MERNKFVIQDWTGREMDYGTFATFLDAGEYLLEKFPNDEDLQEYYVVEVA